MCPRLNIKFFNNCRKISQFNATQYALSDLGEVSEVSLETRLKEFSDTVETNEFKKHLDGG